MRVTRRTAFGLGAGTLLLPLIPAGASAQTEFDTLRARAAALITGGAFDAADPAFAAPLARLGQSAAGLRRTLVTAANRTHLWPDLPLTGVSGDIASSYTRLRTLAAAWATPGTTQYGDAGLAGLVLDGLDFLYGHAYNESKRELGNWWHWEIGAPKALMDTCVLLHDLITPEQRAAWIRAVDRFCPDADRRTNLNDFAETGANRADKALIVALRGIVGRSPDRLALARDGLSSLRDGGKHSLFGYVTRGDGYYEDGSFVQHDDIAYTGSYGVVLLGSVSTILALLAGSSWAVTDPKVNVVLDSIERTYAPWIHDGLMMDSVRGRGVSRQFGRDQHVGADTIGSVLLLADGAPEPYATRFRELCAGWIERGSFLEHAGVAATARAAALTARPAPRPVTHRVFADMDRVVHRRAGWSAALSLSSRRIAGYECGNGENYRGWYQGDGVLYLYLDQDHYTRDYWPTVDSYRLPGTTVDTRPRTPAVSSGGTGTFGPGNAWAGGVVLDDHGLAGLDLMAMGCTLRARKSWFFLDDAIVCLGAGITSTDGRTIETVVENRGTSGTLVLEEGWAHLEGVGGYAFLDREPVRSLRESRTDHWRAIDDGVSTGGTTDPVTREYVTLWYDHGVSPAGASYAYAVLPGATPHGTRRWRGAQVLANTAQAQAVRAGGLVGANFWSPGTAGGVTADAPCAVLVSREGEHVRVAVSDPGRTVATVTITLDHPALGLVSADDTVTVRTGRRPAITVDLAGSRGHTHTAHLTVPPHL
ncbi:polysaccharide lyase 8 family protein [Nonomuraea soli]|uniref:Hyaluronate lyase n=1 Tax=Nonomuraea soli TaxID=1032476 RepID=A0A7W0CRA7_9ACTN|nr:polysaccharide lyase 8 family protein [Nonomuraea soli]MBA2895802.1 hyaluronate lyase [Nonomuraea soli]